MFGLPFIDEFYFGINDLFITLSPAMNCIFF